MHACITHTVSRAAGADGDGDDEAFLDAGGSVVPEVSPGEAPALLPS